MKNFIITLLFISIISMILTNPYMFVIAMIAIPLFVLNWSIGAVFGFVVDLYFLVRRGRCLVESQIGKPALKIDID